MKAKYRQFISIIFGVITIGTLIGIGQGFPSFPEYGTKWLIFTGLITFTAIFGIPLGGGEVSILPMISLAAMMVLGAVPAGWAAVSAAILHGVYRLIWGKQSNANSRSRAIVILGTTSANLTMHTASILISGHFYILFGGNIPITTPSRSTILALYGTGAFYIASNYLIASLFISLRGKGYLSHYFRHIPNILIYEIPPVIFAPLIAQIFIQLGTIQFISFSIGLIVLSLILRSMAISQSKLERRIKELDSLHAVSNALSSSLDIQVIAETIYIEVVKLMSASNFYLSLYDKDIDEVSFPLAYEFGKKTIWKSRAAGNGLTEYILRTRTPLLIQTNVTNKIEQLGADNIGREALSWLGVPILAGDEPLGVLAVQSLELPDTIPQTYDASHQEMLVTIASQASAAIQNARLFSQTDEELAQRVQELDSIMATTQEGILLVDRNLKVLAANRAMADFLGVTQTGLTKQNLELSDPKLPIPLEELIGFSPKTLSDTLHQLLENKDASKETILFKNDNNRPIERVITPVLDEKKEIKGWLFVFRDLTEEHQLAQLREDLTHMLVHDLRSPIVNIRGGIDMIEILLSSDDIDELKEMLQITRRGSDQMLDMINELLDISKFESGAMLVKKSPTNLFEIYQDVYERVYPIAKQNNIIIRANFSPDIPTINCDSGLVKRVIHNILDNAIKFSPEGGKIEVLAKLDDEIKEFVVIKISDNGEGIPDEYRKRIFQKYETVPSSAKRGRQGTGIGLYYCTLALEAHQGQIWVESEIDEGSTFCFRLPVSDMN